MYRRTGHNGGNGVLVDELRVTIPAQQYAEIIEPCHYTLQFYPIDQKYRQRRLVSAYVVQECVLKALGSFGHCFWSIACFVGGHGTGPHPAHPLKCRIIPIRTSRFGASDGGRLPLGKSGLHQPLAISAAE
jgi:hypothetical protein